MIILVDIGNSRFKWTKFENQMLGKIFKAHHLEKDINHILDEEWGKLGIPERVFIANVAGEEVSQKISQWIEKNWPDTPYSFAKTQENFQGLVNGYEKPEQLGVDRWINLVAAYKNYSYPVAVVDCGTAITLDVISQHGKYLGGLILPGLRLMRQSLLKSTPLSYQEHQPFKFDTPKLAFLATNTKDAIYSGSLYSLTATLEHFYMDFKKQKLQWILTGGDAEILALALTYKPLIKPDLIFEGLAILSQEEDK